MSKISQWAQQQPTILIDCALSYGLEQRNIQLNNKLWTASALQSHPDIIKAIHKDYFNAGSNMTVTDTYQGSVPGFIDAGYTKEQAIELIQRSVKLAREAQAEVTVPQTTWVAGAIGPYGAFLADGSEYVGNYGISEAELIKFHQDRLQTLVEAGVDLLAFETIPDFTELKAIKQLLSQYPGIDAFVSCSIKDAHHISDGTDLLEVQALLETIPNVIAYGFNCNHPEFTVPGLTYLHDHQTNANQSLIVFPNSGAHYDPSTKEWSQATAFSFGKAAKEWQAAHAKWIGGCCEVSVQDERDMRDALFPNAIDVK
ncbi:homocysteine S-methyltransferase [Nicoliella spurrieriana]|uniref:Homocysteine S-methyltransferase n=1 Tax=Nicoliella spurrieriana TaxID=2925830 RepID=A0A976X551_9LACO|nr:homocysteine S-methyltransferase [Nicoliella spurrieriana]UQS86266.1 homocysteine S-methyltransferase [Nicoliella spurrieriana]